MGEKNIIPNTDWPSYETEKREIDRIANGDKVRYEDLIRELITRKKY